MSTEQKEALLDLVKRQTHHQVGRAGGQSGWAGQGSVEYQCQSSPLLTHQKLHARFMYPHLSSPSGNTIRTPDSAASTPTSAVSTPTSVCSNHRYQERFVASFFPQRAETWTHFQRLLNRPWNCDMQRVPHTMPHTPEPPSLLSHCCCRQRHQGSIQLCKLIFESVFYEVVHLQCHWWKAKLPFQTGPLVNVVIHQSRQSLAS